MFKNLSLKNKLAISASAAIVIGGVLVEALSFNASLSRLDLEVEQRLQGVTASYNQYVSDWLVSKQRALTSLTSDAKQEAIVAPETGEARCGLRQRVPRLSRWFTTKRQRCGAAARQQRPTQVGMVHQCQSESGQRVHG